MKYSRKRSKEMNEQRKQMVSIISQCVDVCVCVCVSAGDGVLRCRLGHRPAEEDQRELSEGGLDLLHLQRGAASE